MYLEISLREEPDTLDEIFHTQTKRVNPVHEASDIAESGKRVDVCSLTPTNREVVFVTQTRDLQVP